MFTMNYYTMIPAFYEDWSWLNDNGFPAGSFGATDYPICTGPGCATPPDAGETSLIATCDAAGGTVRTQSIAAITNNSAINFNDQNFFFNRVGGDATCDFFDFDPPTTWSACGENADYMREVFSAALSYCSGTSPPGAPGTCRKHIDNSVCFSNLIAAWFSGLKRTAAFHTTGEYRISHYTGSVGSLPLVENPDSGGGGGSSSNRYRHWSSGAPQAVWERYRPETSPDLLIAPAINALIRYTVGGAGIGWPGIDPYLDDGTCLPTSVTYCDLPNAPPFDGVTP